MTVITARKIKKKTGLRKCGRKFESNEKRILTQNGLVKRTK